MLLCPALKEKRAARRGECRWGGAGVSLPGYLVVCIELPVPFVFSPTPDGFGTKLVSRLSGSARTSGTISRYHTDQLSRLPVWVFSVSPICCWDFVLCEDIKTWAFTGGVLFLLFFSVPFAPFSYSCVRVLLSRCLLSRQGYATGAVMRAINSGWCGRRVVLLCCVGGTVVCVDDVMRE